MVHALVHAYFSIFVEVEKCYFSIFGRDRDITYLVEVETYLFGRGRYMLILIVYTVAVNTYLSQCVIL